MSGSRTVLFVYVAWSSYAVSGRRMMEQAERRWANEYGDSPVSWCAVDVEAGAVPRAVVADWLALQQPITGLSAEQLMMSGWGSIIWMEHGKAVGLVSVACKSSVEGILATTRDAFGVRLTEEQPNR
jgi:hypothetical protein